MVAVSNKALEDHVKTDSNVNLQTVDPTLFLSVVFGYPHEVSLLPQVTIYIVVAARRKGCEVRGCDHEIISHIIFGIHFVFQYVKSSPCDILGRKSLIRTKGEMAILTPPQASVGIARRVGGET